MKHYIFIYDCKEQTQRQKVIQLIEGYGFQRVQYSMFAAHLSESDAFRLINQLKTYCCQYTQESLILLPVNPFEPTAFEHYVAKDNSYSQEMMMIFSENQALKYNL